MRNGKSKKKEKEERIALTFGWEGFRQHLHYDYEIEMAVVGICLLEENAMPKIHRILHPDMFYGELWKQFYAMILTMYQNGMAIDLLTVHYALQKLPADHPLWKATDFKTIHYEMARCTSRVVSSAHLVEWAFILREQYVERQTLILTTAGVGGLSARDKIVSMQRTIDELMQFEQTEDWMHISGVLVKLYQHMQAVEGKDLIGVPFGFADLDTITGGITPGLYYLGARPSVGKTALAIRVALNQAAAGIPVGFISLETESKQLGARMLSQTSGKQFWRIFRNKLTEEEAKVLYSYTQSLAQLPVFVSDTPAVGLTDIRSKAVQLIQKHHCGIIWIDYIQLVEPDEGAGTREQEVARLSRGLKLLSMQLGIPIIALAQLSRESEKRSDPKPRLIDLRESGSLEQDADGVMLLHRPERHGIFEDEEGNSTKGLAELELAKWRNGETLTHKLRFLPDRMDFGEWEVEKPALYSHWK